MNRFSVGACHCLDPYHRPPVALPRAYVPRMIPASGLCPKCWANEIVLRSIDTNIAPSSRYTGTSTTRLGAAAARRARGAPARPAGPARRRSARTAAGSVRRWAANHKVPARHSSTATPTPAAGNTSVASSVTAAGPITKHTSSATDSKENAVCSRGEPASSALHRARTMVPSDGMAAPAITPGANQAQAGRPASTAATSAAVAAVNTASSGRSTRRWPRASTSRPICGEVNA